MFNTLLYNCFYYIAFLMVSFSTQYCLAINPLERLLALRPEALKAVSGVFITAIIYLALPVPIPDEEKKLT